MTDGPANKPPAGGGGGRMWAIIISIAVSLVVIGYILVRLVSLAGNSDASSDDDRDSDVPATAQASPTDEPTPSLSPTSAPQPEGQFSDGRWLVGEDIAPGTYQVSEEIATSEIGLCGWNITTDIERSFAETLDSDLVDEGRPTVTLEVGNQFKTTGCGDWAPVE